MMTGSQAVSAAAARLRAAGVEDPVRDARRLLAHALGIGADRLTLHLPDPLDPAAVSAFEAAIVARLARQPVSQIVGWREFYGQRFRVTADVLDPRPETEVLVDAALERPAARVLDLGTGSGAILLSVLTHLPQAVGVGVDLSDAALEVARANARDLGLAARASFQRSDWCADVAGAFDLIVANPPYVSAHEMRALSPELRLHEPRCALTDEGDGLGAYRAIAAQAPAHLALSGRLALEVGPTQAAEVGVLLRAAGLRDIAVLPDLDGRSRVVTARCG